MIPEESKQLCLLFAEVLDYPGDSLSESTNECLRQLDVSFLTSLTRCGHL